MSVVGGGRCGGEGGLYSSTCREIYSPTIFRGFMRRAGIFTMVGVMFLDREKRNGKYDPSCDEKTFIYDKNIKIS